MFRKPPSEAGGAIPDDIRDAWDDLDPVERDAYALRKMLLCTRGPLLVGENDTLEPLQGDKFRQCGLYEWKPARRVRCIVVFHRERREVWVLAALRFKKTNALPVELKERGLDRCKQLLRHLG